MKVKLMKDKKQNLSLSQNHVSWLYALEEHQLYDSLELEKIFYTKKIRIFMKRKPPYMAPFTSLHLSWNPENLSLLLSLCFYLFFPEKSSILICYTVSSLA